MSDIALSANGVPGLRRAERLLGDERLARLAGRGDARAFATLYERHHQAIYRYCRSIVGNEHDAQDALQNAMMRAYSALGRQQHDLAVKPWLFRIAHNEAVTILRRRRPEQQLSEELEQRGGGLDGELDTRERLALLVADLQVLPERQRSALVMRELSGLSMREIAHALSISPGAAKQTLFEARSSLHELAEGRAMQCEAVREAISARDGRVLRGRRIRAHLSACEECQTFREAIGARQADLRAIAPPLPAAAAGAILLKLLGHGGGGHAGGAAAAYGATTAGSGTSLGGHAVLSLAAKGLAGVAVMAAATAGTVHLATGGHGHRTTRPPHASLAGAGAHPTPAPTAIAGAHLSQRAATDAEQPMSGKQATSGSQGAQAPSAANPSAPAAALAPHGNAPANRTASNPSRGTAHGHSGSGTAGESHGASGSSQEHHRSAPSHSGARHGSAHPTPAHHAPPRKRVRSSHGEAGGSGHGVSGASAPHGESPRKQAAGAHPNLPHATGSEAQPSSSSVSSPK